MSLPEFLKDLFASWPLLGILPLWMYSLLCVLGLLFLFLFPFAGVAVYIERKIAGDIQARIGPNVVGPYGILQWIADALKLLLKEDIIPALADKKLFIISPMIIFLSGAAAYAVIPFAENMILADLNIGIFYLIAITSMVALGLILGGWASNNKWSLLGGMRAAAQIVSFEVPVALCILTAVLVTGTLDMTQIVKNQSPYHWNIFHNPFMFIAAFVYYIAALAEANRTPFDIPEADSELVSGYNTEYSGMRFAIFFLIEYAECFVICAVATTLFLGGWHPPFIDISGLALPLRMPLQVMVFMTKAVLLLLVMMWIRWTLPRYRVDQLMKLCWEVLVPFSFACLLGTAFWMALFKGKGIPELIYTLLGWAS
ncbi:MAG: NADH-quinone oxidoreductase subunit NuoH [Deltaproteobacteria bacterium]|nr:NADH-quinone oxidoreductase subunit NuoH [Deltaproteobacteria bacterium]MBI3016389.1 NADH-quinone oxidoreductase subunit NuoH [Deltaproteobacteria bacterium]